MLSTQYRMHGAYRHLPRPPDNTRDDPISPAPRRDPPVPVAPLLRRAAARRPLHHAHDAPVPRHRGSRAVAPSREASPDPCRTLSPRLRGGRALLPQRRSRLPAGAASRWRRRHPSAGAAPLQPCESPQPLESQLPGVSPAGALPLLQPARREARRVRQLAVALERGRGGGLRRPPPRALDAAGAAAARLG